NRFIYYNFFLPIFYFYATAFLSSYLSERLRRTRTELEEMDEDFSDLKLVHEKILNSMTAGLILTNFDGRIHFINEAGLHLLGLPLHQILGRPVQNLFTDEIRLPQIRETLIKHRVVPMERNYRNGKELLLMGMNLSFMHTKKGNPSGIIVVFQDITDTRKMERQLRLQERMVAIGTMAAGIAHEIRNPLAAIRGSVQMLKNDLQLSDEQQQLMEIVLTESMRLDQTIQNFLNYAKPKELKKEKADLKRIVTDMLSFIQKGPDYGERHKIVFSNSHEDFQHDIDSNQMKQVIWNLSINALRAMPDGGTLRVMLERDLKGNVFLSFHDEGKGIEPDRLDSIFDPFQNSTTGGSGLGMAIVYRIIQDHNGQISIDSHPGRGTTITISLPLETSRAVQPLLQ
ncbi:MAG TPA: ATP-binding protein, partial [Acidobacteriota bacterium]